MKRNLLSKILLSREEESRGSEKEQNILDLVQPEIEEVDRKDVISTADEPKSKDTPQMTSEEQKRFAKAELMAQKNYWKNNKDKKKKKEKRRTAQIKEGEKLKQKAEKGRREVKKRRRRKKEN
ncbi:AIF_collapsed_G0053110.mRNA.1.CDS.1 [Saccharomyces cerevisiae]|nr:AIF_collapsed_G0053110.mRNA.1.CDS.1 [Saccharomyces cerevisiae]